MNRSRAGFTLIELMVVIAVVALLMAILLPSLNAARAQGRNARCLTNLRQLAVAVTIYTQEHRDFFPPWGLSHGGSGNPLRSWISTLGPEYGAIYDPNTGDPPSNYLLRCPADDSPHWREPIGTMTRQTSYASNYLMSHGEFKLNRMGKVLRPSGTIFWAELVEENRQNLGYPVADHYHPDLWMQDLIFASDNEQLKQLAANQLEIEQHGRRSNYGLLDGHAESLPFERTFACDFGSTNIMQNKFVWFHNKHDPTVGH